MIRWLIGYIADTLGLKPKPKGWMKQCGYCRDVVVPAEFNARAGLCMDCEFDPGFRPRGVVH